MAIGSATVILPAPTNEIFLVPVIALPEPTLIVKVPLLLPIALS